MSGLTARLMLLGFVGVGSLVLVPIEQLAPTPLSPVVLRLLALLQPAVLVLLAVGIGAWMAPRVGLEAPLVRAWAEKRPLAPILRTQLPYALIGGAAVAAVLTTYDFIWRSYVATVPALPAVARFAVPLPTKILYGGIAEELLMRWGLMSALVWLLWRWTRHPQAVPKGCYWVGAGIAALLFAVGHIPIFMALLPSPPLWLLAAVVIGNALPGLLFGWLFWRKGLEAAMIAHAFAHLGSATFLAVAS